MKGCLSREPSGLGKGEGLKGCRLAAWAQASKALI